MWLHTVKEQLDDRLQITWRSFLLEQANRPNKEREPDWRIWEQPDEYASRGLWAFRAAEAARNQGSAAHDRYHLALLRARHEDQRDIADKEVLSELAEGEGLNLKQFQADLVDRGLLQRIGADHTRAIKEFNVFGTPTFVFGPGQAAYIRILPPPPPEEAVTIFNNLRPLVANSPTVLEVKRPQKKREL